MPQGLTDALVAILVNIPLAAGVLFAFYKGWFRLGTDVTRELADKDKEIQYRDARIEYLMKVNATTIEEWKTLYNRERDDRIAAVVQIASLSAAIKDAAKISERSLAMTEKLLYEYVGRGIDSREP